MNDSKSNMKTNQKSEWKGILSALLLAVLLRWQVLEPRWIPSGSMLPTLQIQDKILIEKVSPRLIKGSKKKLTPGTIVVFKPPRDLIDIGYSDNSALIKRVVGVSGDEIEIKKGFLYRNGEKIDEPWINEAINYEMRPLIVPKNSLWVLGDNRNNSLDSHFWGPLPQENLIGTAFFRYWPIKDFGPIRFPHPKKIRSKARTAIRS
tara:strand:+ start:539 stop:1153 length:615 start_codon:yes stop_codon:yes gene_type:complete